MITAQDIREKTFEKATFGGYDMGEVDDFLDEMAADIAAYQKELATRNNQMKVLAKKIEEYRSTEDDMKNALLAAQQIERKANEEAQAQADAIVAEAQAQADAILAEAQAKADAVTGNLGSLREIEEKRLDAAKTTSAAFIGKMLSAFTKQTDFLKALNDMEIGAPAAEEAPAAEPAPVYAEPAAEEPAYAEEEPAYAEEEPAYEDEAPADEFDFSFDEEAPAEEEPAYEEPAEEEPEAEEEEVIVEEEPVQPARPARRGMRPARPARPARTSFFDEDEDDDIDEPTQKFRF